MDIEGTNLLKYPMLLEVLPPEQSALSAVTR